MPPPQYRPRPTKTHDPQIGNTTLIPEKTEGGGKEESELLGGVKNISSASKPDNPLKCVSRTDMPRNSIEGHEEEGENPS